MNHFEEHHKLKLEAIREENEKWERWKRFNNYSDIFDIIRSLEMFEYFWEIDNSYWHSQREEAKPKGDMELIKCSVREEYQEGRKLLYMLLVDNIAYKVNEWIYANEESLRDKESDIIKALEELRPRIKKVEERALYKTNYCPFIDLPYYGGFGYVTFRMMSKIIGDAHEKAYGKRK